MKTQLLSTGVVVLMAASAHAAVFMTDDFDSYTLGGLTPQGSWAAHSGAGSNPVQVVTAPAGLTGNSAQLMQVTSSTREDINKPLGPTMVAGQKWYAAFDVVVTGAAPITAPDYFAHFKNSATVFPTKIGVGASTGSDFTFYVYQGSSSTGTNIAYWPTGLSFGSVHRIVASYEINTGKGELWLDPNVGLGEAGNTKIEVTNAASATAAVVQWGFRQGGVTGNGSTETVDNLIVGDTWAEVAVPEPVTLALMALGALPMLRRRR